MSEIAEGPVLRKWARTAPSRPQRYMAFIAYDGTNYKGWQVQPGHASIQGEIEAAIRRVTGRAARVHSSGRTDTGVHAREQPAHFDLPLRVDPSRLHLGLNAVLPGDIRILRLKPVPADMHARYSCVGKEYRYFIWNGPVLLPFVARYRAWERAPLDVAAMRDAARRLVGRRDFAPFAANPKRETNGTVRDLRVLDARRRGADVVIRACADGFLYRMARSLAGFLIRVGRGDLAPDAAEAILSRGARTARVPTAPPQGLFLWKASFRRRADGPGACRRFDPRPG